MDLLWLLILLIVDMLLDRVVLLKQFNNELSILLALDPELVSLRLDLHDPVPLGVECSLHLLHGPLELGLLLLPLLELPLDSVHQLLPRPHLLQLLVPLHAVPLEGLHPRTVVIQNLSHLDAHIHLLRGTHMTQLLRSVH